MGINANVHGQCCRVVGQAAVRMPIKVPRSAKRVMPDAHGVVAQDDDLVMKLHFRELLPPAKFGRDLACAIVVVPLDEEDVFAPILFR